MSNNVPSSSTSDASIPQNAPPCPTFSAAVPEQELGQIPDLPPRQLAALELMLLGNTDTAISTSLHIDRKTLYRWRTSDPSFRAAFQQRQSALLTQTTTRFRSLLDNALDALEKQVKDPYTPTSHRAAKTLLSLARISALLTPPPPKAHGSAVEPPSTSPPLKSQI